MSQSIYLPPGCSDSDQYFDLPSVGDEDLDVATCPECKDEFSSRDDECGACGKCRVCCPCSTVNLNTPWMVRG